jgi:hypothetical protein
MSTEVGLEHEELLLEQILGAVSLLTLDSLLPHPHELPFFELLEEIELLDVIIGVSLNKPLTK